MTDYPCDDHARKWRLTSRQKGRRTRQAIRPREKPAPPISHDDVLNFHEMLEFVFGVDKGERDFFARFDRRP